MYCGGRLVGVRRGEHVVPEALGGTVTIRSVCRTCNTGVLSQLDKELVSKSPLSLIVFQERGKKVEYVWDVDHSRGNLLLEAHPTKALDSFSLWPQLLLDHDGLELRGDEQELIRFGALDYERAFMARLRHVLHHTRAKKLILERIAQVPPGYRYPPRVFSTRRIEEFEQGMAFQCRFAGPEDRRRLIRAIEKWPVRTGFATTHSRLGSPLPTMKFHYDRVAILRAFTKQAINMLAHVCRQTQVDDRSFPGAIAFVLGNLACTPDLLRRCGFALADDLIPMGTNPGEHRFRLVFDKAGPKWTLYSSFLVDGLVVSSTYRGSATKTG